MVTVDVMMLIICFTSIMLILVVSLSVVNDGVYRKLGDICGMCDVSQFAFYFLRRSM